MHAPPIFIGLQILDDNVADEIRWSNILRRTHSLFINQSAATKLQRAYYSTLSIAFSILLSDVSRPSTASVSNSGGEFFRPHTATRIG